MNEFLFVVYPYLSLTLLVVGTLARYNYDQIGWTSKSSELLEKRLLRVGSLLFHWGIIFVFFGHVAGLLIPISVYQALGISEHLYHLGAMAMGGLTGLMTLAGLGILLLRRLGVRRVMRNTAPADWAALGFLIATVAMGLLMTLGYNVTHLPYEYRTTVGPWIRGVLLLHPDAGLMAGVPLVLKIHILTAFGLFAISPFTRLVHIWSLPLAYLRRAPMQYRRRGVVSPVGDAGRDGSD
ncbi:MAG: respiratory nitrate reductase subunit gamma [Thermaerobacter sp.]|nr:respiratory nitrate reductase subunit gamma [Thermaerobacter sp.]